MRWELRLPSAPRQPGRALLLWPLTGIRSIQKRERRGLGHAVPFAFSRCSSRTVSNTYGYDPRSYLGGRYPESVRWTALLREYGWDRSCKILLIAPPPMALGEWVQDEKTIAASHCLAKCYENTAQTLGIGFADAGGWGVDLAYDGVHFSEAGHLALLAFKEEFWRLSVEGCTGNIAFRRLGYDPEVLGFERVHNITKRIRRAARTPEGFKAKRHL